jgi:hypothetical protein
VIGEAPPESDGQVLQRNRAETGTSSNKILVDPQAETPLRMHEAAGDRCLNVFRPGRTIQRLQQKSPEFGAERHRGDL